MDNVTNVQRKEIYKNDECVVEIVVKLFSLRLNSFCDDGDEPSDFIITGDFLIN